MKTTLNLFLTTLICMTYTASSFAEVSVQTNNCPQGFSPNQQNLSVSWDGAENYGTLGYQIIGEYFSMRLEGCSSVGVRSAGGVRQVLCDDRIIGTAGAFRLGDTGEPFAQLTINSDIQATVSGSCRPQDHQPLTIKLGLASK